MSLGAINGAIFTSPPSSSIYAAIEAVQKFLPSGILLIVPNYTGDRLNFGLAREWALSKNIQVRYILNSDNINT